MATCDMCGTSKGPFYNGKLEGTTMKVCQNCRGYTKEAWLIKDTLPQEPKKKKLYSQQQREEAQEEASKEIIELIVSDYGKRIRQAREKKGLNQANLAKQLAVKESELHAWESNHRKPRLDVAQKLEKALHITLIESFEEKKVEKKRGPTGPLTIGDLLKQ